MRYSRLAAAVILLGVVVLARNEYIAQAAGKTGTIKVLVPQADATVKIDGKKIPGEGTEREIRAPALKPGKKVYTVEVMWEPNNYTKIWRKKAVTPNLPKLVVDLTKKNPEIDGHIE